MENNKIIYPSKFKSAVEGKCPRCRTGNMFEGPVFSLKMNKLRAHCPHCNLKFEKEPGYFYVAMFISYVFVVAELVTACVATYILTGNDTSPWLYVIVSLSVALILAPFNGRYSRVALLYWLTPSFRFKPEYFGGKKREF